MTNNNHYDVIIIGTGAGGGTLAYALAGTGKRILLLMGHISFLGKLDADTLRAGAPKIVPGWSLELMAKHSLDFWLTSEDLPDPNNRVTLNRQRPARRRSFEGATGMKPRHGTKRRHEDTEKQSRPDHSIFGSSPGACTVSNQSSTSGRSSRTNLRIAASPSLSVSGSR